MLQLASQLITHQLASFRSITRAASPTLRSTHSGRLSVCPSAPEYHLPNNRAKPDHGAFLTGGRCWRQPLRCISWSHHTHHPNPFSSCPSPSSRNTGNPQAAGERRRAGEAGGGNYTGLTGSLSRHRQAQPWGSSANHGRAGRGSSRL